MSRRAARISYDEMKRIMKGVMSAGFEISSGSFDGENFTVHIKNGDAFVRSVRAPPTRLIREPKPRHKTPCGTIVAITA